MSKFKRTSIHYQLFMLGQPFEPHNITICLYIGGVVRGIILSLIAVLVGILITITLLEPIIVGLGYLITGYFIPFFGPASGGEQPVLIMGIAFWLFILLFFGGLFVSKLLTIYKEFRIRRLPYSQSESQSEISPFTLWMKSRKEKLCFFVEFNGSVSSVFKKKK